MPNQVALSFSGGKDSCLALYYLQKQGVEVKCLLTTVLEDSQETVAHNENLERIEQQARQLDIPVYFIETDFPTYETDFIRFINDMKQRYAIDGMAFGDIYLQGHREWGEKLAAQADVEAVYPLWSEQAKAAEWLRDFINLGFEANVIKVDDEKLPQSWAGRQLDDSFVSDILMYPGVCPMGESGEYHTYVHDGPIFRQDE